MVKTAFFSCLVAFTLFFLVEIEAEFVFQRIKTACNQACTHGGCEYEKCRDERIDCDGGACLFKNCDFVTCNGGACIIDNCLKARCGGGGCNFKNQKGTLDLDTCTGESCTLEGIPLPVLHRGEFLTV